MKEMELAPVCSAANRGSSPLPSYKPHFPDTFWLSYSPGRQATPLLSTSGLTSLTMVGADRPPQAVPEAGDVGGVIAVEVSSRALALLTGFNTSVPVASFLLSAPSDTIPVRQAAVKLEQSSTQKVPGKSQTGEGCAPSPSTLQLCQSSCQ